MTECGIRPCQGYDTSNAMLLKLSGLPPREEATHTIALLRRQVRVTETART